MGTCSVSVTENHPFLVCKPKKTRVRRQEPRITRTREYYIPDKPKFVKAKDMQMGDYLVIPKNREIGNKLGEWEIEYENGEGVVRRAKQYLFKNGVKTKSAYASIQFTGDTKEPPLDKFVKGCYIPNQLRKVRRITGVKLENYDKAIYPIWKYEAHPDDWFWDEESYYKNYHNQLKKVKEW